MYLGSSVHAGTQGLWHNTFLQQVCAFASSGSGSCCCSRVVAVQASGKLRALKVITAQNTYRLTLPYPASHCTACLCALYRLLYRSVLLYCRASLPTAWPMRATAACTLTQPSSGGDRTRGLGFYQLDIFFTNFHLDKN